MASGIDIGEIVSVALASNRESDQRRFIAEVQISGGGDTRTVELWPVSGLDSLPPVGSRILVIPVSNSYLIGIAADDGVEPSVASGERRLYATDSGGAIAAEVLATAGGEIVINAGEDWAVQYSALKSAFDTLKQDLNNLVQWCTSHMHPTAAVGAPSVAAPPPTASAADVSGAKIAKVRVP